MSIDNPLVVINSLTATIIKHENTIEDLSAKLKAKGDTSALENEYKKLVAQLTETKVASDVRIHQLTEQLKKERARR